MWGGKGGEEGEEGERGEGMEGPSPPVKVGRQLKIKMLGCLDLHWGLIAPSQLS